MKDAYLVIGKCDMDLKKLLKSNKYLQEVQCKSIIYDILCGLNYLHKSHICHRDLKPANILVNDDCTIEICDFGLSRSLKNIQGSIPNEEEEKKEVTQHKVAYNISSPTSPLSPEKHYNKSNRPSLKMSKSKILA